MRDDKEAREVSEASTCTCAGTKTKRTKFLISEGK